MSRVLKHTLFLLWTLTLTAQSQVFTWHLHATSTWLGTAWFSRLGQDFIPLGPPIHWCSKPWDPFYYPCLLVLRVIGFLLLPLGFKSFWLFLLAFSFSFYFFRLFFFSLLFLASRIIFMIFQILSNMSPFSSFFQEPTFMNHKFKRHMHCLSIHSENKSIATTSK